MGRPSREGERPVSEDVRPGAGIRSTAGHEESRWKMGGPPSKPKYYLMTDRGEVPRGKGEKDPMHGSEKNLKPCVYKHSERVKAR